jgi:hypothetical protein
MQTKVIDISAHSWLLLSITDVVKELFEILHPHWNFFTPLFQLKSTYFIVDSIGDRDFRSDHISKQERKKTSTWSILQNQKWGVFSMTAAVTQMSRILQGQHAWYCWAIITCPLTSLTPRCRLMSFLTNVLSYCHTCPNRKT